MQQTCWSACLIPIRGSNSSQMLAVSLLPGLRYLGCRSRMRQKARFFFSPSFHYCCQRNHFIWLPRVQQIWFNPSGCRGPKEKVFGEGRLRSAAASMHHPAPFLAGLGARWHRLSVPSAQDSPRHGGTPMLWVPTPVAAQPWGCLQHQ